jgi:DNA-binding NtrC family response regulator
VLPPYLKAAARPNQKLVIDVGATTMADAERELLTRTLENAGGNKAEAARQLGVDVKTIYNKLKAYNIES